MLVYLDAWIAETFNEADTRVSNDFILDHIVQRWPYSVYQINLPIPVLCYRMHN